jgi:hypothetical protein
MEYPEILKIEGVKISREYLDQVCDIVLHIIMQYADFEFKDEVSLGEKRSYALETLHEILEGDDELRGEYGDTLMVWEDIRLRDMLKASLPDVPKYLTEKDPIVRGLSGWRLEVGI